MINRIEISELEKSSESISFEKKIKDLGFNVEVISNNIYTINYNFSNEELIKISHSLHNPIFQKYNINSIQNLNFDYALELGFLPGVTDNIANTTTEIINDLFKINIGLNKVFTSKLLFIKGNLEKKDVIFIAENLINTLIERFHIKTFNEYSENGMDKIIPIVKIKNEPKVLEINLNVDDEELIKIGKDGIFDPETNERRGPLALDINYLKAIQSYFKKENRNPTDIEIETIAQTWSEHCKHTIFASELDEIKDGIFSTYIKESTKKIRNILGKKDFCISVFKDNSGSIIFDENYMLTDKAETHNSPSALDPFGGAITGIVGVNRDTMGFGLGALPIANKYGFCLGKPEDKKIIYRSKDKKNPVLLPKRIMEGVIHGVNVGGNCSGIPTPTGFIYFDDKYKGKPLIFVGTLGLIPHKLPDGRLSHEKKAKSNDNIVMVGGRVGKDGIHGATFSSEALTSGSPATAVQIGDPITQKKMSDAIIKEARDLNLYNSITDNGAGGLSSSVGEMAEQSNGFILELEKVPLKYPGLQPWEIWISESQERMTLSISNEKLDQFLNLMKERGVEATVIGKFTDDGRGIIKYNDKIIFDLDLNFLHDGLPKKKLITKPYPYNNKEPEIKIEDQIINHNELLLEIISSHNNCSFEFISRQYDHEVQNNSVVKPLQGEGRVNGTASVIRPLLNSYKGIVMSQAIIPKLSEINCYDMASCTIDTSIRNAVAVGGNIDHMALMDNFCWCSSNEPERLYQLKEAAKACYDYSISYLTPLISGKDSMFNDFKGFDENNNPIKISVHPTLMISSTSVIEDVRNTTTMDFKKEGDLIYVVGETKDELGGSELYNHFNEVGKNAPKVNSEKARKLYQKIYELNQKNILNSCYSIVNGGIIIGLAKKAISGKLGAEINLNNFNEIKNKNLSKEKLLYSETQSRFIITIDKNNKEIFEKKINEIDENLTFIGIVKENKLIIDDLINLKIDELELNYKKRFKDY
jgi:phosphoribosylformylglycinamidine synthase subunit PurSL